MVFLKCNYANCKLGAQVEKDVAVKISNKYYHKECADKHQAKHIAKSLILNKYKFVVQQVNMVIKKHIDDDEVDVGYFIWCINKIIGENLTLNNPFGLSYYIKDGRFFSEYKKIETSAKAKEMRKSKMKIEIINPPTIKPNKRGPAYGTIIKNS